MGKVPPLFKHQKKSLKLLDTEDRVFDMSDPGTGKTRVHIEDFVRKYEKCKRPGIVFAPKSILESAWGDDIDKFAAGLPYSIAYAENREDAFHTDAALYITNLDAVTWLASQPEKFLKRFFYVLNDESTAYKHMTSKRSKAAAKIKKYFPVRRNLSGTPNPNGMCDLWHQVYLLDDGKRLGTSFYHFRSSVCTPIQVGPMPNMVRWEDRPGAELAVMGLLKDITIRHELRACIDMPENHIYPMVVRLPAKHMAYYRKMEADSILQIRNHKVSAINGAVLYGKLQQIASGAVYDELGNYAVLDTGRYETIADLVEQRKQTVVFIQWEHQRDLLIQALESRGLSFAVIDGSIRDHERPDIIRHFQAGFYRALLLHPKSAGHGMTATAANTTIWASPTVNAEWWKQGNARMERAGQTQRMETIVLVAKGTVDEKIYASCDSKTLRMSNLLRELVA